MITPTELKKFQDDTINFESLISRIDESLKRQALVTDVSKDGNPLRVNLPALPLSVINKIVHAYVTDGGWAKVVFTGNQGHFSHFDFFP